MAGSPWTSSGVHPESMTRDQLLDEIAVFEQQDSVHGGFAPRELAQMDCLYHYLSLLEEETA